MNEREFDQWWKAHRAAFLRIDQWLGKMPTDSERRAGNSTRLHRSEIPDNEVTQGDVLRDWRKTLTDVPLKDALDVTASMSRGDTEMPRDWDDHARHVRKHARPAQSNPPGKPKGRRIGDEWVYECGLCMDQGLVDIWAKKTVDAASKDPEAFLQSHKGKYRHVVACTCAEGQRQVQLFAKRKQFLPVFDERRMYLYVPGKAGPQALVDAIFAGQPGEEWTGDGFTYDAFAE